jgi:hypothetical protein
MKCKACSSVSILLHSLTFSSGLNQGRTECFLVVKQIKLYLSHAQNTTGVVDLTVKC